MTGDEPALPDLSVVGRRMLVDHRTVEVVSALRRAGVEPVLLKGPVMARWLYDRAEERPYHDIDLLVAPGDRSTSETVLEQLGYARRIDPPLQVPLPGGAAPHAATWQADGGVAVDLHRCLHHTEHVAEDLVWHEVWRDHHQLEVNGASIAVPAPRVRALHVVLHLQPKDEPGSQAWLDLERAISQVEPAVWADAVDLAERFGVRSDVGPLLALVPGGAELAGRLRLPTRPPDHLRRQHRRHAPTIARLRLRLEGADASEVVRVLRGKLAPARVRAGATPPGASLPRAYAQQARRILDAVADWARSRHAGPPGLR